MGVTTQSLRRKQYVSLHPLYHRRTGMVKSFESPMLNCAPFLVSREFCRNSYADGSYAAHLYINRRKNCRKKQKLQDSTAHEYVLEKLNLRWSPEQTAGCANLDNEPFSVSFPTIYRMVDSGILPKEIKKIMRFKWKHKKCRSEDKRGKIPDTTPISKRPAGAENCSRFEHLESDTVIGMRKIGCFGTNFERKSGYLVAFKLDDRQHNDFNEATIKAFSVIPNKLQKSFTVDNGKEFAAHKELIEATEMNVYFCDPYSPWQCGTNENTNDLLQQFFPKDASFADVSDEELQRIEDPIRIIFFAYFDFPLLIYSVNFSVFSIRFFCIIH